MSWRAAYMLGAGFFTTTMLVAAAHFHNWWSVLFFLLAFSQSCATGERVTQWSKEQ